MTTAIDDCTTEAERIGHRLSAIRRYNDVTQKELAIAIGTKQPQIARVENGSVNPTLGTVLRMANALGYTLELVPVKK